MDIIFTAIFYSFLPFELVQHGQYLLSEAIVAIHEHLAEHVVWSGIQRKKILLIIAIVIPIQVLRAVGIQALQSQQ